MAETMRAGKIVTPDAVAIEASLQAAQPRIQQNPRQCRCSPRGILGCKPSSEQVMRAGGIESCNWNGCGYKSLKQKRKKHDRAEPGALCHRPVAEAIHG